MCKAIVMERKERYSNTIFIYLLIRISFLSFLNIGDFLLLMMIVRQSLVFKIEKRSEASGEEFPAGHNYSVYENIEKPNFVNPVKDYVSDAHTYLDIVKRGVLISLMWIALSIVFLAGTERTNLFSLGYLIGAFVFLWQGSDFYLRPVQTILTWWNLLIGYNVVVIFAKSLFQGVGCVMIEQVYILLNLYINSNE